MHRVHEFGENSIIDHGHTREPRRPAGCWVDGQPGLCRSRLRPCLNDDDVIGCRESEGDGRRPSESVGVWNTARLNESARDPPWPAGSGPLSSLEQNRRAQLLDVRVSPQWRPISSFVSRVGFMGSRLPGVPIRVAFDGGYGVVEDDGPWTLVVELPPDLSTYGWGTLQLQASELRDVPMLCSSATPSAFESGSSLLTRRDHEPSSQVLGAMRRQGQTIRIGPACLQPNSRHLAREAGRWLQRVWQHR